MISLQDAICPICTEYPNNPVETQCCGRIFCQDQLLQLKQFGNSCPICRENIAYHHSKYIQRILNQQERHCKQCNQLLKLKSMRSHTKICKIKQISCRFCKKIITREKFLKHIEQLHYQQFILFFSQLDFSEPSSLQQFQTLLRYDSTDSTWGHDSGKIDAICFSTTRQFRLCGFVQFEIYNWHNFQNIAIQVRLYENKKQIYKQEVLINKEKQKENIRILFSKRIQIKIGSLYDLLVQNISGGYFQTKYGKSGKENVGPITFQKSNFDNNGSDVGSGQINSLIVKYI